MKKLLIPVLFLLLTLALVTPALAGGDSTVSGETCTIGYSGYIDRNGGLWLWGENYNGQAGQDKSIAEVKTPAKVMDHVVSFCRNDIATIVLKDDGSVWTFGGDFSHGTYTKTYTSGMKNTLYYSGPEPVKLLDGCTAVSIGSAYPQFGALKSDGSLYVWGDTFGGGLGITIETPGIDKSYFSSSGGEVIKPYKLLDNVRTFSIGKYNGMAVKTDGSVWYWGLDNWLDTYPTEGWLPLPPTQLSGLSGLQQFSLDGNWLGVVMQDNTYCFCGFDENMKEVKLRQKAKVMGGVRMVSGNFSDNTYVLKTDGNLFYGLRGNTWVMSDVSCVYQSSAGRQVTLILKTDGTLYLRTPSYDASSGTNRYELTQIASGVALPGQPFSSIQSTGSQVGSFTDVSESDWFAGPVAWAVKEGITTGTTKTTFTPERTCTVAEILTFLWRSQNCPAPTIPNPYRDVPAGQYYTDAAIWAYEKGLVEGSEFHRDADCTRAMVVTYLFKLSGEELDTSTFIATNDVKGFTDLRFYVTWAIEKGITEGIARDQQGYIYFGPDLTCTRGQIVTFLYRAYANP